MPLTLFFPATCELCGHWIPQHAASCPRNGVHPSQWSYLPSIGLALDSQVANHHRALNRNYFKRRHPSFVDWACESGPISNLSDANHTTWN